MESENKSSKKKKLCKCQLCKQQKIMKIDKDDDRIEKEKDDERRRCLVRSSTTKKTHTKLISEEKYGKGSWKWALAPFSRKTSENVRIMYEE